MEISRLQLGFPSYPLPGNGKNSSTRIHRAGASKSFLKVNTRFVRLPCLMPRGGNVIKAGTMHLPVYDRRDAD